MKFLEPRRAIACHLAILAALIFVPSEARSSEAPKVSEEEAKAEFEKTKSAPPALATSVEVEVDAGIEEAVEEKPPRKRLFSRFKNSAAKEEVKAEATKISPTQEAVPNTTLVPAEAQAEEIAKPAPERRLRLFGRKKAEREQALEPVPEPATTAVVEVAPTKEEAATSIEAEEVELLATSPEVEVPEEEPRKRFSLFRRHRDKDEAVKVEIAEASDEQEAEPAGELKAGDPTPAAEELTPPVKKRKRLLGGLFTKDKTEKVAPEEEMPPEEMSEPQPAVGEASVVEEAPAAEQKQGGSLFGFFKKGKADELATAEKTKLGNSVESKPGLITKNPGAGELGLYVVTESEVPFYAIGPGQPLPPEKLLDRGSRLTVTKGGWGWSNVRLGSGELGVISSKAMRPATVAEIARHNHPVSTASKSRGSRRLFNILSRGPAPKPDLPTDSGSGPIRNFGLLPPVSSGD